MIEFLWFQCFFLWCQQVKLFVFQTVCGTMALQRLLSVTNYIQKDLFLFGFKNHFNIITPADTLRAKRPNHCATVLHLFNCYVKISPDAVDSSGIIRHLSEAPHQTPWGRLANLISPVCFSNCILLHLGRQKQMHQVIWVQTPLQRIHAVSVPLTSSVYLVLPDALILPAAPKGPLSRKKVSTPFSAKAQH